MSFDEAITKVQKLEVKDGETLVFFIKQSVPFEDIKMFEARMRLRIPAGVKILTLNADAFDEVKVLSQ
jgi:hypothetical protein